MDSQDGRRWDQPQVDFQDEDVPVFRNTGIARRSGNQLLGDSKDEDASALSNNDICLKESLESTSG